MNAAASASQSPFKAAAVALVLILVAEFILGEIAQSLAQQYFPFRIAGEWVEFLLAFWFGVPFFLSFPVAVVLGFVLAVVMYSAPAKPGLKAGLFAGLVMLVGKIVHLVCFTIFFEYQLIPLDALIGFMHLVLTAAAAGLIVHKLAAALAR